MKMMTLYQPHATLMVIGAKRIETRPRKWGHMGRVGIHAGSYKGWLYLCEIEPFKSALAAHGYNASNLPLGALIGEVSKLGCHSTDTVFDHQPELDSEMERAFGNYTSGRWAFPTAQYKRYKVPVPMRGHQGYWTWNDPTEKKQ